MMNMYHLVADNQDGKRGVIKNYLYYMKCVKEWDKKLLFCMLLMPFPKVVEGLAGALLPSVLVSGLEMKWSLEVLLLSLAGLLFIRLVGVALSNSMNIYMDEQSGYMSLYFMKKYVKKIMHLDYELLEDEDFKQVADNVWGVARFGRGMGSAVTVFPYIMLSVLGMVVYGILLCRQSVWIVVLIIASVYLDIYLLGIARKKHKEYFSQIGKHAKRDEYITIQSMDSSAGKDIRIYHMLDWFLEKYDDSLEQIGGFYSRIHNWYTVRNLSAAVLGVIRNLFAYGLLTSFLVEGKINAASFVLYIGLINSFSEAFEYLLRTMMNLNSVNTSIGYIRTFEQIESEWGQAEGLGAEIVDKMRKSPIEITLKNVSYTYPGNQKPTLKNINLTIKPGEKLALIGLNGAGKTTLVKLICGFYDPTEGEILCNQIPIKQYSREEYYSLLSVLFQDATLLPTTIDENIAGGRQFTETQREVFEKSLRLSGFGEKYESLTKKGDTHLVKKLHEDAVDFSGGELQKLLFARAIFKDAGLTILDEPTAALDPIAENDLYQHFGEAVEGRTSLYISHRLSSTRFCDRIVLLENGRITEEGTHESLLAAGGRYTELFEMQSKYYREQEENRKRSALMGDEYREDKEAERGIFRE